MLLNERHAFIGFCLVQGVLVLRNVTRGSLETSQGERWRLACEINDFARNEVGIVVKLQERYL